MWTSILAGVLSLLGGSQQHSPSERTPAEESLFGWKEFPPLPDAVGFAGAFAGVSGGALIVAGGANFPGGRPWEGHPKVWHEGIFVLKDAKGVWSESETRLPRPAAYGVSLTWGDAMVAIGGGAANEHHDAAFLVRWSAGRILIEDLPALPKPLAFGCGALAGDIVFVVGGIETPGATACSESIFAMDLAGDERAWVELAPLPGAPRMLATAGTLGDALYVFGGCGLRADAEGRPARIAPYFSDGFRMDLVPGRLQDARWESIRALPFPSVGAPSPLVAVGSERLALFGGDTGRYLGQDLRDDHPGFEGRVMLYDATLDRWSVWGRMPAGEVQALKSAPAEYPWPVVTTPTVIWNGRTVLPSGEIRPGVRTRRVQVAEPRSEPPSFGILNYVVLSAYLAGVVLVGAFFSRREKTTEDFFLGGRRIPWWAAGTSVFATQLSAITFLALPAKTYATDWTYFLQNLGIVAITPLLVAAYIPAFRRSGITSIYAWLGQRFDARLRVFGVLAFVSYQLARMGIVLFLPALALSAVTGMDVRTSILVMGVLSTIYTVLGGIEAVIWTDVLQVIVLLGGALFALAVILTQVEGGFGGALELAQARDKLRFADLSWDWTTPALGVILLGAVFNNLVPYTSDQAVVQRYLTTSDEPAARRAAWAGAWLSVPASFVFFGMGTALFAFYASYPGRVDPNAAPDQVFATFIVRELPAGLSGLVIAGVFAAAMSSLDSSMNAVAAVLTPASPAEEEQARGLRRARWITVLIGVIGTSVALALSLFEIRSLLDRFLEFLGLFGGTLGGLFALGILTRRPGANAAIAGALLSLAALAYARFATELSPLLYSTIGMMACFLGGLGASKTRWGQA